MRKFTLFPVLLLASVVPLFAQSGTPPGAYSPGGGGTAIISTGIPGTPGVTAVPVQSGLLAEYRMFATENPCALVDYSGNSNNATGCVGTTPAIIANTGGFNPNGAGGVALPAALNSAKTILVYVQGGRFGSPVAGSTTSSANSTALVSVIGPQNASDGTTANGVGNRITSTKTNGTECSYSRGLQNGNGLVGWVMDTTDRIYFGATETPGNSYFVNVTACVGVQTVGNYQLGGNSGNLLGLNPVWYSGPIYYAVFYSTVLTPQQMAADAQYINATMTGRGVPPTTTSATVNKATGPNIVCVGDSITAAVNVAAANTYCQNMTIIPTPTYRQNQGETLLTAQQLLAAGPFTEDPAYVASSPVNLIHFFAGTNDIAINSSITDAEEGNRAYCTARHLIGWKCIVTTMVSRTGIDASKDTLDTWLRQNWRNFADGLTDLAADPNLGADGANASGTYFFSDHVHPSQHSIYNDELPIIQRSINRLLGNNDFSSANVYASAASAAVATTAGSLSTNTLTVTFAATPANCQVGNTITLAAITPAGDNGNWTILTRTTTQVTVYIDTSLSPGNITVQGTGVCPQQQDADVYSILNFGAGNFTLESCQGWTGQNIYIRDINGVATTLVPFGSETITGGGASPTTVATNTTAILQAQLVSAAAGGCNWVRLQ